MKRSKLLVLSTFLLAALMLFSACNAKTKIGSVDLKGILKENAAPTDQISAFASAEKVDALKDAQYVESNNTLAVFTKSVEDKPDETKYMVYNMKENSVVWEATATETLNVQVNLDALSYYADEISYFTVITAETTKEQTSGRPSVATKLYSAKGDEIASVKTQVEVETNLDLIKFGGKCYRMSETGAIAFAFDYASVSEFPSLDEKYDGRYYEFGNASVAVYDESLTLVSKYVIDMAEIENTTYAVLENGNVFVQYVYEADPYTEDYTVFADGEKYDVVSKVVDVKKGTAKDVKCDCVFMGAYNLLANGGDRAAEAGLNTDKVVTIGYAAKITDKRLGNYCFASLNNSGKVSELGKVNGADMVGFDLIDTNRWVISTTGNEYLVDFEGKVLGEVSEASVVGKLLVADGKAYDSSLALVKDFAADGWTLSKTLNGALLLEGAGNSLAVMTANGEVVVLVGEDSKGVLMSFGSNSEDYIVIKTESDYEIYNAEGKKLTTIDAKDVMSATSVASCDGAVLVKIEKTVTNNGDFTMKTVYYRLG